MSNTQAIHTQNSFHCQIHWHPQSFRTSKRHIKFCVKRKTTPALQKSNGRISLWKDQKVFTGTQRTRHFSKGDSFPGGEGWKQLDRGVFNHVAMATASPNIQDGRLKAIAEESAVCYVENKENFTQLCTVTRSGKSTRYTRYFSRTAQIVCLVICVFIANPLYFNIFGFISWK